MCVRKSFDEVKTVLWPEILRKNAANLIFWDKSENFPQLLRFMSHTLLVFSSWEKLFLDRSQVHVFCFVFFCVKAENSESGKKNWSFLLHLVLKNSSGRGVS